MKLVEHLITAIIARSSPPKDCPGDTKSGKSAGAGWRSRPIISGPQNEPSTLRGAVTAPTGEKCATARLPRVE